MAQPHKSAGKGVLPRAKQESPAFRRGSSSALPSPKSVLGAPFRLVEDDCEPDQEVQMGCSGRRGNPRPEPGASRQVR